MLTAKREKFVQELIKGKSQREAYKEAYNCKNMKDETIDKRASELFSDGEVRGRYDELINKSADEALWTREQAINDLIAIKNAGQQNMTFELETKTGEILKRIDPKLAKVVIDAIKELNNMNGFNEQKIDLKTDNELNININVV